MDFKEYLKLQTASDLKLLGFDTQRTNSYLTGNLIVPESSLPFNNPLDTGPPVNRPTQVQTKGIIFKRSKNFSDRPRNAVVDTVVLHTTDSRNQNGDLNWLLGEGGSQVSSHYLIFREGTIYQLVDLDKSAFHAGNSKDSRGRRNVNSFSIGIEIANRGNGKENYTEAQIMSVIKIIQDVQQIYKISQIVSHSSIAVPRGRKADPYGFPWDRLKFLGIPLFP